MPEEKRDLGQDPPRALQRERTWRCDVVEPLRRVVLAFVLNDEPSQIGYLGHTIELAMEVLSVLCPFADSAAL